MGSGEVLKCQSNKGTKKIFHPVAQSPHDFLSRVFKDKFKPTKNPSSLDNWNPVVTMHFLSRSAVFFGIFLARTVIAAPTVLEERGVSTLSASDLSSLAPFTQFARAAYCPTSVLKNWSCGRKSGLKLFYSIGIANV